MPSVHSNHHCHLWTTPTENMSLNCIGCTWKSWGWYSMCAPAWVCQLKTIFSVYVYLHEFKYLCTYVCVVHIDWKLHSRVMSCLFETFAYEFGTDAFGIHKIPPTEGTIRFLDNCFFVLIHHSDLMLTLLKLKAFIWPNLKDVKKYL